MFNINYCLILDKQTNFIVTHLRFMILHQILKIFSSYNFPYELKIILVV